VEPVLQRGTDGYDTVEWCARLDGSSGKVGMYGASYVGATQMLAAVEAPPGLTCICPAITSSDYYEGWTYEGGALHLAFAENWSLSLATDTARRAGKPDVERALGDAARDTHPWYWYLPIRDFAPHRQAGLAPYFFDWLQHSRDDDYWQSVSPERKYARVRAAGLHIGGWYDIFLDGTLKNFGGIAAQGDGELARGGQRLLVGPWYHHPWATRFGQVDFGPSAVGEVVDELQVRFYNWRLKGQDDGISKEPPVKLFVMARTSGATSTNGR